MSDDHPTPRRDFLAQLAGSAIVIAGSACAAPLAGGSAPGAGVGPAPVPSPVSPSPVPTGRAHEALDAGDSDVQAVIVIRHAAIPMAFNNAMWAKYPIGKDAKIKDGRDWATRNPYLSSKDAGPSADVPSATLSWLASHGHVLLGCNLATLGFASSYAAETHADSHAVYEDLKANVVPGLILQPNGVYAVLRAQEAGCTYFKAS